VSAEGATSLRRGLDVLVVLADEEALASGGLGVTRIAELIGKEKSQVSRTLRVLDGYGFVDRDSETLDYRLGWRLFAFAGRAGEARLRAAAPLVLRRLVQELGEAAHLSVLQDADVLTVLSESPPHAVQAASRVGRTVPVHCTSSGRALLFGRTDREVRRLLAGSELTALGPNAPRSVREVLRRLAEARACGFATVDEELEPGLVGVAAPIHDFHGTVVAALNVSAPKFRFGDRLQEAGESVRSAAAELSELLGSPAP
jgi:IclR family transcriptional regulator, KDG regulon repressor